MFRLDLIPIILFWLAIDIPYLLYRTVLFFTREKKYKRQYKDLVSLIIPAYNEEKTIEETLKTSIEQDYGNLEIIIVNDGSKDDTKKTVENFIKNNKKARISLINKENEGKAKALNTALQYCLHKASDFLELLEIRRFPEWLAE